MEKHLEKKRRDEESDEEGGQRRKNRGVKVKRKGNEVRKGQ